MTPWRKLVCYARRRSPWLFHMNAGSCNGCDIELVAALAPRYDAEQLGVRLEGSPRHADILCITGPVTKNAVGAIHTVYGQVCEPKAVVAIGSCPATTNVFIDSRTIDGPLQKHIPVDVFVPGCPPRPDAIIQGVAKAAAILAERGIKATADPYSTSIAGAISAQGRLSTRVAAATSAQDDRAVQGGVVKKEQP
ncbi:MAG: NADH-quinone oxidoreductase subunit NuoB [Terracidiphilus sp.]